MTCEFCGGQTEKKKVKRQHWLKGKLYIVENVDAEVCPGCGERYFHARILDEIDAYYPLMRRLVHTDLDHLAGTWSEKDFAEFQKRTADFEAVDEKMWK